MSKEISATLFNPGGQQVGSVALSPVIFGAPIKEELLHSAVRWQRAKKRAGTHDVLTRSEIKGGAKKPYKQKGTGRARAGSSVSPIWVGGAVVHGPTPRSYEFRMAKGMKQSALASALSLKGLQSGVVVLEGMDGVSGKTKDAAKLLSSLSIANRKVLVVVPDSNSTERALFVRGLQNIPKVVVLPASGVNVYDVLNCESLLCVQEALVDLNGRFEK